VGSRAPSVERPTDADGGCRTRSKRVVTTPGLAWRCLTWRCALIRLALTRCQTSRVVRPPLRKQRPLLNPGVHLGRMPARRMSPTRNRTSKTNHIIARSILVDTEATSRRAPDVGRHWHPRCARVGWHHLPNVGDSKRPGVTPSSRVPGHAEYTVVQPNLTAVPDHRSRSRPKKATAIPCMSNTDFQVARSLGRNRLSKNSSSSFSWTRLRPSLVATAAPDAPASPLRTRA
jgi:hypothetical protein